jgi:hypothetical protein
MVRLGSHHPLDSRSATLEGLARTNVGNASANSRVRVGGVCSSLVNDLTDLE